ncbi:Mitogen-activated protein kinase kinase 5 [Platanthera guangdongensis]|uniref:Mitogen-activated protein kinase kinase 5 n=1 Tax=Platanthera guangdongensis TaxID=2320717 RepID=A0ABR2LYC2_9ASPA
MVEMATGNSPWVSDEMKDFVSKCLIHDPKQRWTAEELLRHPYMVEAEETEESLVQLCSSSKQGKWVSPKSTLESCL